MSEPKQTKTERRRTPRVAAEHELTLRSAVADAGGAISATSIDLNLGGIYCTLNRHIPLFSKMEVTLELPIRDEDEELHQLEVGLVGVVVRIEPEEPDPEVTSYAAALAFVNLDPQAELALARYILQALVQE